MENKQPSATTQQRDSETGDRVPADFPWPIVLGLDPGTRIIGYGALVLHEDGPRLLAAGTLRPPGSLAVPARLGHILRDFEDLLARLRPSVLVIEEAFAFRNIQSALRVGEGRGVVMAAAARAGLEIVQYTPATAKKAITGNGRADKTQVAQMVAVHLNLAAPPASLDASDALALALAYAQKGRLDKLARRR
ncbi:MAG: crossover junction endodeoxyribonuclease RuvC [Planctomycetota bacterium]|jgi:crossover junction endodeoxyribonuclease RuvC|nr:crossover junction endodeoxyribonuclease RuvC [Planctomycetota bacterium]